MEVLKDNERLVQAPTEPDPALGEVAIMSSMGNELQDIRIESSEPVVKAAVLHEKYPLSDEAKQQVVNQRKRVAEIVSEPSKNNKLLVVVGPCSIHDPVAALEYADWLKEQSDLYQDDLEIVMRTYIEKPRTTKGWKGLVNDPGVDGKFDINAGLEASRKLLTGITEKGLGVSTELLDTRTPQYLDDLMVWSAIGARTTESQPHRELASGVSYPVGFKNNTSGEVQVAVNAMLSSAAPHRFIGSSRDNGEEIFSTKGNKDTHVILRGGLGTNYSKEKVKRAEEKMLDAGFPPSIMVDCSHDNSVKDYKNQTLVAKEVAQQVSAGDPYITGAMIESNLKEGSQKPAPLDQLTYGQSITDGCAGLDDTAEMFRVLSEAVEARRQNGT